MTVARPRFSLVVPTRERPDTLAATLASVLAQDHDAFEVVVADNGSSQATAKVVASFADARLRHVRAPRPLAMAENWELGLGEARGEYMLVLGDDDALVPGALGLAEAFFHCRPTPILAWYRAHYWWPDALQTWNRDRLAYSLLPHPAREIRAAEALALFYRFEVPYFRLPMVYNAFVHRDVIARVKRRHGRYFLDPAPDIHSGIVNALACGRFYYTERALSIAGVSGHSTGASQVVGAGETAANAERFYRENAASESRIDWRVTLDFSRHYAVLLANTMLNTLWWLGADAGELRLDIRAWLHYALGMANSPIVSYDETLAVTRRVARTYGVPFPEEAVPPRRPLAETGIVGQDGPVQWVDTAASGIRDVLGASRLLQGCYDELAGPGLLEGAGRPSTAIMP